MKKILILLIVIPVASYAQYTLPPGADQGSVGVLWPLLGADAFISMGVAVIASRRGWDGINVFFVSLFLTPVVAAIMYTPYKQPEEKKETIQAP